jgi:glycosyltransferase involved in cell wall biosynthesis
VLFEQLMIPRSYKAIDLLYCPGNFSPSWLSCPWPVVVTQQSAHYFGEGKTSEVPYSQVRKRIETRLAHRSIRRADAVAVVSNYLLQQIAAEGLPLEKCHVIRSGVESWPRSDARVVPPWDFFLAVGNDYPHKRLLDLVDVWASAFDIDGPGLVVVGDVTGARQMKFLRRVPHARRRKLSLLGGIRNRGELRALFEAAIAAVSASSLEAGPLVPMEAGSLGCPVILSEIPAHREAAGTRADYFSVGDVRALSELLRLHCRSPRARAPWKGLPTWHGNALQLAELFERAIATS